MQLARHQRVLASRERRLSILLYLLLATMLSVECLARVMHDRRMATLRVEDGVRESLLIRHSPNSWQVLFAGNSLVFDDLSRSALQQTLGPGYLVHTAGVPGSTYSDWQFGLRALLARGSQPDAVVFSISPSQFLRAPAATPVPVSLLWRTHEILAYQRDQHLNLTQLTELLLEHYSTFYSLRNTLRIYIRKFIPGYEAMVYSWTGSGASGRPLSEETAEAIYSDQLASLVRDCDSRAQFILMLSPTNQIEDERLEPELKAAAEAQGIAVIDPVAVREWPLNKFREDQYHLTPNAADEFSKLVATDLRQKLAHSTSRASRQ